MPVCESHTGTRLLHIVTPAYLARIAYLVHIYITAGTSGTSAGEDYSDAQGFPFAAFCSPSLQLNSALAMTSNTQHTRSLPTDNASPALTNGILVLCCVNVRRTSMQNQKDEAGQCGKWQASTCRTAVRRTIYCCTNYQVQHSSTRGYDMTIQSTRTNYHTSTSTLRITRWTDKTLDKTALPPKLVDASAGTRIDVLTTNAHAGSIKPTRKAATTPGTSALGQDGRLRVVSEMSENRHLH